MHVECVDVIRSQTIKDEQKLATSILGHNYIGGKRSAKGRNTCHSLDAGAGAAYPTGFYEATESEGDAAEAAYPAYRELPADVRADFLEAIAAEIEVLGGCFIADVMRETALPSLRITGERARTCSQMRLFAKVLRRGDFHGAWIDVALPERKPMPRPDLRQHMIGVGPVAIFGASNFPLAFSVAGGDTAAALAARCPVVVKAHTGHMATSEGGGRDRASGSAF